jgi:hypothetical protein
MRSNSGTKRAKMSDKVVSARGREARANDNERLTQIAVLDRVQVVNVAPDSHAPVLSDVEWRGQPLVLLAGCPVVVALRGWDPLPRAHEAEAALQITARSSLRQDARDSVDQREKRRVDEVKHCVVGVGVPVGRLAGLEARNLRLKQS